jgi:hypothetical protein
MTAAASAAASSYVLLFLGLRLSDVSMQVLTIARDPVKYTMQILTNGSLAARGILGSINRRLAGLGLGAAAMIQVTSTLV